MCVRERRGVICPAFRLFIVWAAGDLFERVSFSESFLFVIPTEVEGSVAHVLASTFPRV